MQIFLVSISLLSQVLLISKYWPDTGAMLKAVDRTISMLFGCYIVPTVGGLCILLIQFS